MVSRMDLLADLQARGLIHDATDLAELGARLAQGPIGVYVGFDPTADSLHVGHLLGQLTLRRFQLAGHRPVPLAGGATGMVGDPGGRSEERNLLDRDTLRHNVACIKGQLEQLLDFGAGPAQAMLVDNADWTEPLGVLQFLRDVGKHVTVNQMVARESVRARMESGNGISYTEFSYMLLQANDFRHLCEHHDVEMQMGGSDQWGNIVGGIDLIRRVLGRPSYGLTWPLLLKSDGSKFGKTAGGAVWLDQARTSPYQFRQFWVQTDDAEVRRHLLQFTLRPIEEVEAIVAEHQAAPERRSAQRLLAGDVTSLVHGADAASAAEQAADVLFGADPSGATPEALEAVRREVPTSVLSPAALTDPVALLVRTGLASSNGDARRTLAQGGVRANGHKLEPATELHPTDLLLSRFLLLRKGRTTYHLVEISESEVDAAGPFR
jgi:tyrosyl-tRNA synthetase